MKLASHNSFTFLPARKWWMKLFVWMARCQRVNIAYQYTLYGVKCFDLRLRFEPDGTPYVCHGLIEFDSKGISMVAGDLVRLSAYKDVYIRMVLEDEKPTDRAKAYFSRLCQDFETYFPNIHFFGGNDRSDWGCKNPIYKFKTPMQDLDDKYSSTTNLFPWKWMHRLDDLCPILYARLHNRKNITAGTTHEWLFIDFVDIGNEK